MTRDLERIRAHREQLLEARHGTISNGTNELEQLNHGVGVPFVKTAERYPSKVVTPDSHVEKLFKKAAESVITSVHPSQADHTTTEIFLK